MRRWPGRTEREKVRDERNATAEAEVGQPTFLLEELLRSHVILCHRFHTEPHAKVVNSY